MTLVHAQGEKAWGACSSAIRGTCVGALIRRERGRRNDCSPSRVWQCCQLLFFGLWVYQATAADKRFSPVKTSTAPYHVFKELRPCALGFMIISLWDIFSEMTERSGLQPRFPVFPFEYGLNSHNSWPFVAPWNADLTCVLSVWDADSEWYGAGNRTPVRRRLIKDVYSLDPISYSWAAIGSRNAHEAVVRFSSFRANQR